MIYDREKRVDLSDSPYFKTRSFRVCEAIGQKRMNSKEFLSKVSEDKNLPANWFRLSSNHTSKARTIEEFITPCRRIIRNKNALRAYLDQTPGMTRSEVDAKVKELGGKSRDQYDKYLERIRKPGHDAHGKGRSDRSIAQDQGTRTMGGATDKNPRGENGDESTSRTSNTGNEYTMTANNRETIPDMTRGEGDAKMKELGEKSRDQYDRYPERMEKPGHDAHGKGRSDRPIAQDQGTRTMSGAMDRNPRGENNDKPPSKTSNVRDKNKEPTTHGRGSGTREVRTKSLMADIIKTPYLAQRSKGPSNETQGRTDGKDMNEGSDDSNNETNFKTHLPMLRMTTTARTNDAAEQRRKAGNDHTRSRITGSNEQTGQDQRPEAERRHKISCENYHDIIVFPCFQKYSFSRVAAYMILSYV